MSGRHTRNAALRQPGRGISGNVASVNGALGCQMVHSVGSASGRSAALSAHTNPRAVTPEYQRIVGRGQPVDVAVESISFPAVI